MTLFSLFRSPSRLSLALCVALLGTAASSPAFAHHQAVTRHHHHRRILHHHAALRPVSLTNQSYIVVDAASGQVLSADQADALRYPASLTKLMTLYLTFEALRDHRITLDQLVPVSAHAASMEPSKLGLVPGCRLTVRQAILSLVTKSANDAAAALGEFLGGSEPRFATMMTLRAHALGMNNTVFRNASGLPDPQEVTTARDMAILARHLIHDFPQDYAYFSVPSFVYDGRLIPNHDRMLIDYPGADGMKTGYTHEAGHNLVTSAVHGNVRLIGVVLGAPSNQVRDQEMAGLLNGGFTTEGAPGVMMANAEARPAHRTLVANLLIPRAEAATLPHHHLKVAYAHAHDWQVRLGTFSSPRTARHVAEHASTRLGGTPLLAEISHHGHHLWRAELTGLSHQAARTACTRAGRGCAPIRVASRG